MRDNVGLNQRQQKFVDLVASGQHSVSQCHALAGYGDPDKPDSANAHALKVRLAEFIEEARAKLGHAPLGEEAPAIDDAEKAALIAEQRKLYTLAIERGETGLAQKCLRSIERLLKRPGAPGRPAAQKPTPPPAPTPVSTGWTSEALIAELLSQEEEEEIRRQFPAHVEEQRQRWLQEKPNSYFEVMQGGRKSVLSDGSTLYDFDEPSRPDLKSSVSHAAIDVGEVVKRL